MLLVRALLLSRRIEREAPALEAYEKYYKEGEVGKRHWLLEVRKRGEPYSTLVRVYSPAHWQFLKRAFDRLGVWHREEVLVRLDSLATTDPEMLSTLGDQPVFRDLMQKRVKELDRLVLDGKRMIEHHAQYLRNYARQPAEAPRGESPKKYVMAVLDVLALHAVARWPQVWPSVDEFFSQIPAPKSEA